MRIKYFLIIGLLFFYGCFFKGDSKIVREKLPESIKEAVEVLLNYQQYPLDELVQARKILEEYERPEFYEGIGLKSPVNKEELEKLKGTSTIMIFKFKKIGIEVKEYYNDNLEKITVQKIK